MPPANVELRGLRFCKEVFFEDTFLLEHDTTSGKPITILSRESNVPFFTGLDVKEDVVRNILIGILDICRRRHVLFRKLGTDYRVMRCHMSRTTSH